MKENKQQAQSRLEGGKGKAKVELLRFEGKGIVGSYQDSTHVCT